MAAFFKITQWEGWHPPSEDEELPPVDAGRNNAYELWPDNVRAYVLYCELCTQWVRDANGTPRGFDYAAVIQHVQFTVDDADARRQLYEDVRVMEHAAAVVYGKQAEDAMKAANKT